MNSKAQIYNIDFKSKDISLRVLGEIFISTYMQPAILLEPQYLSFDLVCLGRDC
jgi:hypothetical protein